MTILSEELMQKVLEFRAARDWQQFHTPRNLVSAISVEAAELLELFRWDISNGSCVADDDFRKKLSDEIADLVILISYLAYDLEINTDLAVSEKLATNSKKYPVEKSFGNATKYTELD